MVPLILLLFVVAAFVTILLPVVFGAEIYRWRRGVRNVTCPETRNPVVVRVDAAHSVATALSGPEYLRLSSCTRWPARSGCDQDCVYELVGQKQEEQPSSRGVAHLPVIAGAALAWLLGAIWYARPVFGRAWMQANGLTPQAARLRASMILPYLLPLAGFLILGYFIAWHVARGGKDGIVRGLALGAMLALAYVAVETLLRHSLAGPWLPLSWVERSYMVAGGALTGAVVSGWRTLEKALTFD